MGGSSGYYAKQNKSGSERKILYEFTYVWNPKNKTNKQKKNRLIDREQMGGCWGR